MQNDGSNDDTSSSKPIKIEPPDSDDDNDVGLPLPRYEDVMAEIGGDIGEIEAIIAACSSEEQDWFQKEVKRSIAEVHAQVPWTRQPGAKTFSKYQKMVLAQKKKALAVLKRQRSEGTLTRKNPGRSVKVVNYNEKDSDDDVKIVKEVKSKKSAGQKRKK
ncbi:hypothetical protein CAEBREN_02202 [Caenorhabditis brenneri]|uniref:Uncharacterized protein n=1 Tax=Caenorhabditis brenneri TaxID=135651 RepID=G0MTI5_CAEBE|nr:hypothetical protein CAEBREN_02202 [Caenorhabditis brenneri]